MNKLRAILFRLTFVAAISAHGQAPTGTIAGVVRDPSGAAVTKAQVKLTSLATGLTRAVSTSDSGSTTRIWITIRRTGNTEENEEYEYEP
jgi:hypothetical protein